MVPPGQAPCQEVVLRPPFDIRRLIPATTSTLGDAGPFLNMALLRAEDPETGESDVTIHRMCLIGPDTMTVNFTGPFRHIDQFRVKCEEAGKPLPVSVSIGLDPAVYVATSFEAPTTPLGFDELTIAGGLRGSPVELVDCVSVSAKAIARAEIVIEGELSAERARPRGRPHGHGLGDAGVPRLSRPREARRAGAPRDRRDASRATRSSRPSSARARST